MPLIDPDEIVRADNYINEAERDATPANDGGRVPKLDSDGYLSTAFIRDTSSRVRLSGNYQIPTANLDIPIPWDTEDFDTAAVHNAGGETALYSQGASNVDNSLNTSSNWYAQAFVTGATDFVIRRISMRAGDAGNGDDTVTCSIRASLTGPDLVSSLGTIVSPSTPNDIAFYFPYYKLNASTTYYLIIKPSGANLPVVVQCNTSGGTGAHSSSNAGASWSAESFGIRMSIYADARGYFTVPTSGKYLVQATLNAGDQINKVIKMWVNNTVVSQFNTGDSTSDAGGTIGGLLSLTAGDIVAITLNQSATASDDVQATGSAFEIIRLR